MKKKLPDNLVATRPALADDYTAQHPENGASVGPVPVRYSRAIHDLICDHIKAGNRPHVAAQMAGIPSATFYKWMQAGRANDAHLWEFARDVELAEGCAEGAALKVVVEAFKDDPARAQWYLERGRGAGWSKEVNTRVEAAIGDFMMRLRDGLDDETWRKVLAASSGEAMPELEGPSRFKLSPPKPVVADAETEEDSE